MHERVKHLDSSVGGGGVVQAVPGEGGQVAEVVRKPGHVHCSLQIVVSLVQALADTDCL